MFASVAQQKLGLVETLSELRLCLAVLLLLPNVPFSLQFSWLSKSDEQKDESPSSWRLGLRKTGSHNMLSEVAATREAQRDKTASIYRSSSSPRISALLDNKEKVWLSAKMFECIPVEQTSPHRFKTLSLSF